MVQPIHISDIRNYRACRRRWDWSSPMRRNLEPVIPYAPFFVGRGIHYVLEMHYNSGKDVWESFDEFLANEEKSAGNLWASEQDKWDESVTLMQELIMHYIAWTKVDTSDFRDENLEFMSMEVPFKDIPIKIPNTELADPNVVLEGRFDGVIRHMPTNTYWIWETKTCRSIGELVKSLENDEQAGAYMYAAQQLFNVPVVGVLYNIIRKRAPVHPQVLQSGFLAKRSGAQLTAMSYVMDIKRNHGDADWVWIQAHYGDYLDKMSIGNNGFFVRYPVRRSQAELSNLMNNIYWTAQEMIDPNLKIYPAPTFVQCNFCPFRAPCIAMNKSGNYEALLNAEYQTRVAAKSLREFEDESSIQEQSES